MAATVIDEMIVEIRATAEEIDRVFNDVKNRIAGLEAKAGEANAEMAAMAPTVQAAAEKVKKEVTEVNAKLDEEKKKTKEVGTEATAAGAAAVKAANQTEQGTAKATEQVKRQKDASKELAAEYAITGAAAAAVFAVIAREVTEAIKASNLATNALRGLRSIAEGTKNDFSAAKGAANAFAADGLLNVSDAATSLKNLLARGFGLQEATDLISRLKDSAAFGRQASLTLGEAVRSATEGLKNENSILVDNAGVTKNVAKMWEEYAKSIGKGVQSLTQAEKRQAEYNGIMFETRFMVGDAAKYSQEFAGAQASVEAATTRVQQAIGRAESAALRPFLAALTPIIDGLGEFIDSNPELVAGVTASAGALTALIVILAAYKAAAALASAASLTLTASMGWIGAVALIVGVVAAIAAASTAAETAQAKSLEMAQENISALENERKTLQDYLDMQSSGTASTEDLAAARAKVAAQSPTLVAGYDAENKAMLEGNDAITEQIKLTEEEIRRKRELILIDGERVLATNAVAEAEATAARERERQKMQESKDRIAELERSRQRGPNAAGNYTDDSGGFIASELKALDNWRETAEKAYKDNAKAFDAAQADINAAQAGSAVVRKAMYAQEVAEYVAKTGEMTAAQQYIIDLTNQQAIAQSLTQAEFAALLAANLANQGLQAEAIKATAIASEDAAKAVADWKDSEKGLEAVQAANKTVQDAKALKDYTKVLTTAEKGTDDYNKALKAVAKGFNTSTEAVENNVAGFAALADQGYAGAIDAQGKLLTSLKLAIAELTATKGAADPLVVSLRALLGVFAALGAAPAPTSSGGGGGGNRKKAWEDELEMIGRVMDADKEYAQAYLDHINALLASDRLSKSERARLEKEREYAIMAVDGTLEQEHIEYLERLLEREKLSKDERLELEQELFDAKKELRSREIEETNELNDAIVDALTARYEAEQAAAEKAINDQITAARAAADAEIEAINDVADAKIDAINAEIRALDDEAKAEDRADKDAADQKKIAAVRAQLEYEVDPANRAALEAQLKALEGAYADRKEDEAREDKRQALRDEIEAIREAAADEVEIIKDRTEAVVADLQAQLEATRAFYAAKLADQALQQEAELLLTQGGQDEIIALLTAYAPEYLAKGKELGQSLYNGFKPKIDAILAELAALRASALATIALAAQAGSVTAAGMVNGAGGTGSKTTTINQVNNFNQPVQSPGQAATAVRRASEAAARGI